MAGTRAGGQKAALTNKQLYGSDFYIKIGAAGGFKSTGGGFAKSHELAVEAGRKGGLASRRSPSLNRYCKYGHYFDEANTGKYKTGGRYCRACNRLRTAAYNKRLARLVS